MQSIFNLISTIDTKHHTQAVNTHKTVNYTIADAIDMYCVAISVFSSY